MPKQLIVQVGYHYFTGTPDDMATLLGIAGRLTQVEQEGYRGAYFPAADQTLFVEAAVLGDVDMRGKPAVVEPPRPVPAESAEDPIPF